MNPGHTFAVDMGSDGAAALQKIIFKKLTEFMGDYTDDVLAQYILVLVAHGKHQAQTAKDLEAFLGDQSESFVAWLWNYLRLNLHLHAAVSKASRTSSNGMEQKVEQPDNGIAKGMQANVQVPCSNPKLGEKTSNDRSSTRSLPDVTSRIRNSDYGRESDKLEANERSSDYGRESDKLEANERNGRRHSRHSAKRQQTSMDTLTRKGRERPSDVKSHRKRCVSPLGVNATRRLLQSAVREAVAPVASLAKSGSKRLRSVVSTDVDSSVVIEDANNNDVDDARQGKEKVTTALTDTETLVAVSHNATVVTGSLAGSVWDRPINTAKDMKEERFDGEGDSYSAQVVDARFFYGDLWPDDEGGNDGAFMQRKSRLTPHDSSRVNGYAAEDIMREGPAKARTGSQHQEKVIRDQQERMDDRQAELSNTLSKLVKSSTTELKEAQKVPPMSLSSMQFDVSQKHVVCSQGQEPGISHVDLPQTQPAKVEGDSHKSVLEMKKRLDQLGMEMIKLRARHSESNKEPSFTTSGTEQVQKTQDSLQKHGVFVTNIHFAANKDSVAAHFAQCGKVEQVVLLMDGATGKPKGSAYVEFSTQDDAEKALALNETSFYSRMLKIVRSDAAIIQDIHSNQATSLRHANPSLPSISSTRGWGSRGSFNPVPGFSSLRGVGYGTPTKMQWKRDSAGGTGETTTASNGNKSGQGPPARSMAKSFTYVRNQNASAGAVEGEKGAT